MEIGEEGKEGITPLPPPSPILSPLPLTKEQITLLPTSVENPSSSLGNLPKKQKFHSYFNSESFRPKLVSVDDLCKNVIPLPGNVQDLTRDWIRSTKKVDVTLRKTEPLGSRKALGKIGEFYWDGFIHPMSCVKLTELSQFWTSTNLEKWLVPFLTEKSVISLRLLDFFSSQYVFDRTIKYNHIIDGVLTECDPKNIMKSLRDKRSSGFFAVFCRRDNRKRFGYVYFDSGDRTYRTTTAQLYCIFMAIRHGIVQYILDHLDDVEKAMYIEMNKQKLLEKSMVPKKVYKTKNYISRKRKRDEDDDEDETS